MTSQPSQPLRIALLQLNVSDQPDQSLLSTLTYIREAAQQGAKFVATPECTNFMAVNTEQLAAQVHYQDADPTLVALRDEASQLKIWLLVGSLCLKNDKGGSAVAINRQLLIDPKGTVVATYDKLHMFDVDVGDGQTYRESQQFAAGNDLVISAVDTMAVGHSICYDIRFPYLYAELSKRGAEVLMIPAAFTYVTGQAHWDVLLRARAIETGSWVLAPAQCGVQSDGRRTGAHSSVISPWGQIVAQADGETPQIIVSDIMPSQSRKARDSIPTLRHYRTQSILDAGT